MPNAAAASFDDDFGFRATPRKAPSRKPRKSKKVGSKKSRSFGSGKVARYAAILIGATIAGGTVVNALMMQKGHHPAPLFGKTSKTAVAEPVHRISNIEPTKRETVASTAPLPTVAALSQQKPAAEVQSEIASSRTKSSLDEDAITRLIEGHAAAASSDGNGSRTVLAAQKALNKLGFSVKATGTFGPASRKAVEAFERSRHLPVKGELSARVVKLLGADNGSRTN